MRTDLPQAVEQPPNSAFSIRWAHWISTAGTARSRAGALEHIGQLGIRPDKTAPRSRSYSALTGFGACVATLTDLEQLLLFALVHCDDEPWLHGKRWNAVIEATLHRGDKEPTRAQMEAYRKRFGRMMAGALLRLEAEARAKGYLDQATAPSQAHRTGPGEGDHGPTLTHLYPKPRKAILRDGALSREPHKERFTPCQQTARIWTISSPMEAIRARCLECVGYHSAEVLNCKDRDCALYPFRLGTVPIDRPSRLRAIRKHCLECMNGSAEAVKDCTSGPGLAKGEPGCPVFQFRLGKNPKLKGKGKTPTWLIEANKKKGLLDRLSIGLDFPGAPFSARPIPRARVKMRSGSYRANTAVSLEAGFWSWSWYFLRRSRMASSSKSLNGRSRSMPSFFTSLTRSISRVVAVIFLGMAINTLKTRKMQLLGVDMI